jgi:hypothetical protein
VVYSIKLLFTIGNVKVNPVGFYAIFQFLNKVTEALECDPVSTWSNVGGPLLEKLSSYQGSVGLAAFAAGGADTRVQ